MEDWKDSIRWSVHTPYDRGGQHVGIPEQIVEGLHEPTGIRAACGHERSQHKNKKVVTEMLEWALTMIGYIK